MLLGVAYLLDRVNLRNACVLYFLLVPFFLDRNDASLARAVFLFAYAVSGLVVLLAVTERLSRFSEQVSFRRISLLFVVLLALCFFSLLVNTPQHLISPAGYFNKYLKLIFPPICMFVMLNVWTLKDVPKLYSLLGVVVVISFISFVPEIASVYASKGFTVRAGALLFDDPNRYAIFLNVFYALLFSKLIQALLRKQPLAGLAVMNGLIFMAIFLTQSRSGMVTCLAVTVICLATARSKRVWGYAALAFIPVLLLFLVAVLIRYSQPVGSVGSDLGRLWTYSVGLNIVQDRPFLGIGFGNIQQAYNIYGRLEQFLIGKPMSIHNAMLEIFSDVGIFGLIAYLLMVFVPIVLLAKKIARVWRHRYPVVELAAINIPIVFFIYGLTYPGYLTDDFFWAYMTITLIVLRSEIPDDFEVKLWKPKWI